MKTFNNINFQKYKDEFLNKLGDTDKWPGIQDVCKPGYPRNSIFISEALAVYTLCKEFNIDLLLESGVFRGGSTRIWANVLSDIDIKCVDILEEPKHHIIVNNVIDHMSTYKNIEFKIGDSIKILPELIGSNLNKRIGVFIDGPKDNLGKSLCESVLKFDNVFFTCLHDFKDFNSSNIFSTSNNKEFQNINNHLDLNHPQRSKYPQGPGLWCKIK
tara:strand:- start:809 stop:1453 length:645 start_codon:yes stop_codon:yes gene_type:complete